MNIDELFDKLEKNQTSIELSVAAEQSKYQLDNESLFQLPLISLVILIMADGTTKPKVSQIGQLVGETFESVFVGFKGTARHLGWSTVLRIRSVKALTFLETTGLVEIRAKDGRITTTKPGKSLVTKTCKMENDLSSSLYKVKDAYKNIQSEKQYELKLT